MEQEQPRLIEVNDILEGMTPLQLRAEKVRLLSEVSEREALVRQINDVLGGYGADPGDAYDANDDTPGSPEHPEDNIFQRSSD